MTPHEVYLQLKTEGVDLKITSGRLFASKVTEAQRALIRDNKAGLIVCLTYQCPTCNQPVTVYEHPGRWTVECSLNPTHYSELVTKQSGAGLGWLAQHDEGCPCQAAEDLGF